MCRPYSIESFTERLQGISLPNNNSIAERTAQFFYTALRIFTLACGAFSLLALVATNSPFALVSTGFFAVLALKLFVFDDEPRFFVRQEPRYGARRTITIQMPVLQQTPSYPLGGLSMYHSATPLYLQQPRVGSSFPHYTAPQPSFSYSPPQLFRDPNLERGQLGRRNANSSWTQTWVGTPRNNPSERGQLGSR